ncbi:MAG TPA: M14 family metallopeptidase [Candidatus Acidoferrum sp.]|nr:M14 family metallopeptidase [Candidatus Acidoferrum sp.]
MRTLRYGMSGTDVMEMQATLKKMGYNPGPINGQFGAQTRSAIQRFQSRFGLTPDGIVGPATWRVLERFMLGYDLYAVRPGSTLWSIARAYGTTVQAILTANPGVNPERLTVGQQLVIPYNIPVVDTNIDYTYAVLQRDIAGLAARYPFIQVGSAGRSVLGKELYTLRLGEGPNEVFYNAAHHALEWITAPVLMKFIEDFADAYSRGATLGAGYDPAEIWQRSSLYFLPMVNPDGVDLVLDGLTPDNPYHDWLIAWNGGSDDFSTVWQANIRGVDLNHNYDAAWEESKEAEAALGIEGPGPTRYSGPSPLSEPETQAVADFTRRHNFRLVMAYHSQGEVIYWDFENLAPPEALAIGEEFARESGYALSDPEGVASYAGYKDWFIQDWRRPGYTIEVGLGKNPLPISQFNGIYADNLNMLLLSSII